MNKSILVILVLLSVVANAHWPADSDSNMVISDNDGAQTIARVAAVSTGGCYISWYDNTSGNYDVYMQFLDASGEAQWPVNGLLISNHPQQTWLTDYDLTVDMLDNAIVVFNDIRDGDDWDIFAYRISPDGQFQWGNDGLTLSANDGFEPDPQVEVTPGNSIIFAWQDESIVHVRKVAADGADYWPDSMVTITHAYSLSIPRITQSDNDAVIMTVLKQTGPNYWDPKHLYAYKISDDGYMLWGDDGVVVSNAGGFGPQMRPKVCSDENGGAFAFWYDTRNNNHHVYVQHILDDGTMDWTANGVNASTTAGRLQMSPDFVFDPIEPAAYVFYETTDMGQNNEGVGGQKFNSDGERQWTDDGIAVAELSNQVRSHVNLDRLPDGVVVSYFENPQGDVTNSYVVSAKIDSDGNQVWSESPLAISTALSDKGYLVSDANPFGQVFAVWQDQRDDEDGDIYMQNVNPDGTLGEYVTSIDEPANMPDVYLVSQCYPNPFNASALISFNLPSRSELTVEIFDIMGRKLETLANSSFDAGNHSVVWNADSYSSGVYFYRIAADGAKTAGKMVLLK